MWNLKQVGRAWALVALLGVTVVSMPSASAQWGGNQQSGGQQQGSGSWWNWGGGQQHDDHKDDDRDSRGGKFGLKYRDWDRVQDDMQCSFGSILIEVPLRREDGKSVFTDEVCRKLDRRARNCIVVIKVLPYLQKNSGCNCLIEHRHMNKNHCPGDEHNENAIRRIYRDAKERVKGKWFIAWAPESNNKKSHHFIEDGCNNNPDDFKMSWDLFCRAARDEGCEMPIWWISRWTDDGNCIDPRRMYPGDSKVGGYGGTSYHRVGWNRNSNGQWGYGWDDGIGKMCEELSWFNRNNGRKPCFIETGISYGPWTDDCMRYISDRCRDHSDIGAVFFNNQWEEGHGGRHDDWRLDEWYKNNDRPKFRERCDSFGKRDW